jgi:hypothetical protein
VNAFSPGHVVGPKTHHFRTVRKHRGRTGNQRVRVLVVEKFGKQISIGRIEWCLSGAASQEATSREVPSPKETDTSFTEKS